MKKRVLSLVCIFMLAVSMFSIVGCGGDTAESIAGTYMVESNTYPALYWETDLSKEDQELCSIANAVFIQDLDVTFTENKTIKTYVYEESYEISEDEIKVNFQEMSGTYKFEHSDGKIVISTENIGEIVLVKQ